MFRLTTLEVDCTPGKKGYPKGSLFFVPLRRFLQRETVALWILLGVQSGCQPSPSGRESITLAGEAQGTTFRIVYWPEDSVVSAEQLADSVQRYLADFNRVASAWDTASVLCRFNRAHDPQFNQAPESFQLIINEGVRLKAWTDGWLDPEVGKYTTAWGFNGAPAVLGQGSPQKDSVLIQQLREQTKPCYDVNAYAQGFSVDGVAQLLKRNGVRHALVEIGGELFALGGKPDGTPFSVAVDLPQEERSDKPLEVVGLVNRGMATSGDYRSARVDPTTGRQYGHTLNPFTGWTGRTDVVSATVFARSASEADGVATALVAMGSERAKKWLRTHPECDALLVIGKSDHSWTVYSTPGVPSGIVK